MQELATKEDLGILKIDLVQVRANLREIELRLQKEIEQIRAELKADIAQVKAELETDIELY